MLNGNQHKSNHLARKHPRTEASLIRRPKVKYSSPAHCAHVKRPTRVQLPALQATNARFTPGRGTSSLKNSGDRYKRHAAPIDIVSITNAVTFTRTSADTRVGVIEHHQMPYPRILMDWVASPLRETSNQTEQSSPSVLLPWGIEDVGPMLDALDGTTLSRMSLHGKNGSVEAPNALCPQPEACPTCFLSSSQFSTGSPSRRFPQRGPRHQP